MPIGDVAPKFFCFLQRDVDELLVGRGVEKEGVAFLEQGFAYAHCLVDGVATDVEIEGVFGLVGIP